MASQNRGVLAVALSFLFLLSGPLSQFSMPIEPNIELDFNSKKESGVSDYNLVEIQAPNLLGNGPSIDMDSSHALQTISLSVEGGNDTLATGFDWSDWNQSGISKNGLTIEEDGSLILGFQGINWDFDKNANGWTSSSTSYGQRNTATTCGMSGNTGASWWTRGGSVTVTSPQVNLAGYVGLSLQAWIKQGTYGCGEEPDSNENFYLEYKNSNNGWTQVQYLPGSTTGGQVTNVNYNLPSNAYHSDFQIRARQNAGSGTCCDYWFFDDIIIPGTSGANLTTRSFGWSSNVDERIDEGRYAPVYLDAIIPEGAHLNWTVIDADTNSEIPGLVNRTGKWIDLSVVDWKQHKSLRLKISFASNSDGESPRLYGISGGGKYYDDFNSDPYGQGWSLENSTWNSQTNKISGQSNSTLLSPEFDVNMPFASYKFQFESEGNLTSFISIDRGAWIEINSTTNKHALASSASTLQARFESTEDNWSLEKIRIQLYPTEQISSPRMDIDSDGRNEWDVSGEGIGSWGNQDVLLNGHHNSPFTVGLNPTTWHSILIPRDAKSFELSVTKIGSVGLGVQTIALWIGNTMVTQTGGIGYQDGIRISLNESDLEYLNYETRTTPPVKVVAGKEFIHARIEVISDAGNYSIGGISIGYEATQIITASAFDDIVMSINRARLDSSKSASLPLKFTADSICSLKVSLNSFTTSGDVLMGAMTWKNDSQTLTPSHLWREVNTRAQTHASSPHRVIVNMYTADSSAMWFIPILGQGIIGTGDHDLFIFADDAITHNTSNGIHDLNTRFRTSQTFDDQTDLRLEVRVELANGVVSMPSIRHWSNSAVNNNLMIKSMSYFTDRGHVSPDLDYLMTEDNLSIHIRTGFENGMAHEKPYPGEFELRLTRNNETIANTTHYEGTEWIVDTRTPFTSGDITYEVELIPLGGGDVVGPSKVNRTFIIDPLAPVVTQSNIRYFDHLTPSTNQEIIINISDQPVLPTDVTLMLWTEWANDYDGDGWPSPGEYIARPVTNPSDLDANFGDYVALVDDTSAFPGEKVAGYVIGSDPAGHQIVGGGSDMIDDHLFMYQILSDGIPLVNSEGFEWDGGRRAWLHPSQTYGLNISFTELNGLSDVEEISVSLADNIVSDRLTLIWNSTTGQCSSDTSHIVVNSCMITNDNGIGANPYDQNLVLNIEMTPQWTLPDLGDTRREPVVRIYDRAGNYDEVSFPQNRWRFSTEMMIPSDLSLWVENGALTDDGARVTPGSGIELSGELMFSQTGDAPQFDCEIEVRINGVKTSAIAVDGLFTASTAAPVISGQHAMTWKIDCMPDQGIDLTSPTEAVKWILVDSVGPQVVEFTSPRMSSELEVGEHNVRVIISENFGIDSNSVELFWWVTAIDQSDTISSGSVPLDLDGDVDIGLRLEFVGTIDLSNIERQFLQEKLVVKMRIDGRDIAGNQFERDGNSVAFPSGVWELEQHTTDFSLEQSGVELSKSNLEVDENTIVQIHVRNDGMLGGDAELLVEIVDLSGQRSQLAKTTVYVDSQSVNTLLVDWKPDAPGLQRIEVTLVETTDKTEFVDVKPAKERGLLEDAIGATNPWILGTTMTMLCIGVLFVLSWLRVATAKQGDSELDFEFDDEEFDDED